jgi:hypothetical protein
VGRVLATGDRCYLSVRDAHAPGVADLLIVHHRVVGLDLQLGASFYAFDVLELNGFDLRRDGLEERKRVLCRCVRPRPG